MSCWGTSFLGPLAACGCLRPAGVDPAAGLALAAAMSRHAGVLRDRDGMQDLQRTLDQAPPMGGPPAAAHPSRTSPQP